MSELPDSYFRGLGLDDYLVLSTDGREGEYRDYGPYGAYMQHIDKPKRHTVSLIDGDRPHLLIEHEDGESYCVVCASDYPEIEMDGPAYPKWCPGLPPHINEGDDE